MNIHGNKTKVKMFCRYESYKWEDNCWSRVKVDTKHIHNNVKWPGSRWGHARINVYMKMSLNIFNLDLTMC